MSRSNQKSTQRAHGTIRRLLVLLPVACCLFFSQACSPVTNHKILSTIFDGVPSLPPAEDYCKEYADKVIAAAKKTDEKKEPAGNSSGHEESRHQPYAESRCDDCHDKDKQDGLAQPKRELCFMCHTDFVKGAFVHGPVAVGDCLACHVPHTSQFPSLLKIGKGEICSTCHREKRLAAGLHDMARSKNIVCAECHDPHSGTARYFLR